jgi:pimeloyl-ACP methyl ester carboxylesterase
MPLDYLDTTDNRTVSIAVLKVPATVGDADPSYGGTLMVNPGGPGDSGVVHMLKNGRYIQNMVDGNKHYEVLSFDIRGVAYSYPRADCYANEAAREAADTQIRGLGDLSTSDEVLKKHLALSKAHGYQCAKFREDGVDFNIHEYTSTASIARDMLRLVDETEKLTRKEASQRMGEAQQPLLSDGYRGKEARLQYYGTSYGTILGNTFLSMFPGRVRRMMLDGVVVAESWIKNVRPQHTLEPFFFALKADHYSRTGAVMSETPAMPSSISTKHALMLDPTALCEETTTSHGTTWSAGLMN